MSKNVYEIVTERIIESLAKGVAPWRKPWRAAGAQGMPKNLISGKPYRGINVLLLATSPFSSPYWLTFKQAKERGGSVRKGEKGTPIVFYKTYDKKSNDGAERRHWVMRYFTVFNVEQCDGLRDVPTLHPDVRTPHARIEACEAVVRGYRGPSIETGSLACYSPVADTIRVPPIESFDAREEYYSTLFHEMVHSTGAKGRLERDGIVGGTTFGDHRYSFEELVAECGAAFLCGETGIDAATLENSAAYLAHWASKLKSEPKWIVQAASQAAKAADFVLGRAAKAPTAPASEPVPNDAVDAGESESEHANAAE